LLSVSDAESPEVREVPKWNEVTAQHTRTAGKKGGKREIIERDFWDLERQER